MNLPATDVAYMGWALLTLAVGLWIWAAFLTFLSLVFSGGQGVQATCAHPTNKLGECLFDLLFFFGPLIGTVTCAAAGFYCLVRARVHAVPLLLAALLVVALGWRTVNIVLQLLPQT